MAEYTVAVDRITTTWGQTEDSSALLVGGDVAWADRSDATYAELQVSQYTSVGRAEGWFAATPLPTMGPTAEVLIRVRVASAAGAGADMTGLHLETASTIRAYARNDIAPVWPSSPGWVEMGLDLQAGVQVSDIAGMASAGQLSAEFWPTGPPGMYYVYELELVFRTRPGLHPCRQFPRADGLAASSARRHYPPDESWQASTRKAGGYY